jgi:hypothetical protein
MSLGIYFADDGIAYGLLYPTHGCQKPYWQMAFYSSERARKRGITYLHKLMGQYCPILRFELSLTEIRERSTLAPSTPKDECGELDHVVNPQWKRKTKRPAWKDN